MKRLVWPMATAVTLIGTPLTVATAQQLGIGPKGGVNVSTMKLENASFETSTETGAVVGGIFVVEMSRTVWLQGEALFTQKGTRFTSPTTDATLSVSYVEFPALIKLNILKGTVRPNLYTGVSLAFELSCSVAGQVGDLGVDEQCQADVLGFTRRQTDFSGIFGGGLDFAIKDFVITLDARYTIGLTDLDAVSSSLAKVFNRTLSLTAGLVYMIPGSDPRVR